MAAKKVLPIALLEEDFFDGSALIGISSPLSPSRLCCALNRAFGIGLMREPEQDLYMKATSSEGCRRYFPVFQQQLEAEATEMTLYRLKMDSVLLLPEVPHLDYVWLLRSNTPEADAHLYANVLRELPQVQMAYVLELEQLKNGANLVL